MLSVAYAKTIDRELPINRMLCRLFSLIVLLGGSAHCYGEHASVVDANDLSIDIPALQVGSEYYQVALSYVAPNWIVSDANLIPLTDPSGIFENGELALSCVIYNDVEYAVTMNLVEAESDIIMFTLGAADANPGCSTNFGGALSSSPNILLIVADDMGIEAATECYPDLINDVMTIYNDAANVNDIDGTSASMPNIASRICAQGMIFDNVWAQPSCSPTRATMITGLYGYKNNVLYPLSDDVIDESFLVTHQIMLPDYMTSNGYAAAAFGKWHLGEEDSKATPVEVGFDYFRGRISGQVGYYSYAYSVQGDITDNPTQLTQLDQPEATLTINSVEGAVEVTTSYGPVVKVRDTMDWITNQNVTDPDQPWFVWLALNTPHTPLHTPDQVYLNQIARDDLAACSTNCEAVQYRTMINAMDTIMGSLLDFIQNDNSNTFIIFIGDNGTVRDYIDNLYLTTGGRGKGSVYESGVRVPMAVIGPNVEAGSISSEFVHTVDLFATIIDLAGLEVPTTSFDKDDSTLSTIVASDSVSIAPIIRGEATMVKDPVNDYILSEITTSANPNLDAVAARNATYKLVCRHGDCNSPEFFNLVTDPLEEYPLDTNISCLASGSAQQQAYCMLQDAILGASHYR